MTKAELVIVKKALAILENEFFEVSSSTGMKPFIFIGGHDQAVSFFTNARKSDIMCKLTRDFNDEDMWTVDTEPVDKVQTDILGELKFRILDTMKV